MEIQEEKHIMLVLSTAYLLKRSGNFPTEKEIFTELERRERYVSTFWKNPGGREGYHKSMRELWLDPPEDFK